MDITTVCCIVMTGTVNCEGENIVKLKDESFIQEQYKIYATKVKNGEYEIWQFSHDILYDLCRDNPAHTDSGVVIGKTWLIGRSYAAALERNNKPLDYDGDFYQAVVAPLFVEIGAELDEKLNKLRAYAMIEETNAEEILAVHHWLVEKIKTYTYTQKRSFVSKYLHFHLPQLFYIYDSRVDGASSRLIATQNSRQFVDSDPVYGKFVQRVLALSDYLNKVFGVTLSPREMDDFLLSICENNKEK